MYHSFNPFSSTFTLVNRLSYPQVNTFADLPLASTMTGCLNVVLTSTGAWYTFNRKEAGLYYSDGITWTRLGNYISIIDDGVVSTDMVWSSNKVNTDLGTKAPIDSPTFTGTITIPTPFTLGAVSVLPTGTELNYVDGVTSPIQTQIDNVTALALFGIIA
jgi:hypothetical protein